MSSSFIHIVVQLLSHVRVFVTSWTVAHQASLSLTIPREFVQTHIHWVGDAIQPSHPLSPLLLLPSIFPSIRVFSNESVLRIRWPDSWSFSFSFSPSNEYSGLVSFRTDWLDLVVHGTLKSLHQHHNSKAQFFSAQPSLWSNSLICTWLLEKLQLSVFPVAQTVKNLPATQKTWIQSLDLEDPLEKEMAIYSSILAWRIPWTEEPGGLQSVGLQRVRHDWAN